MKLIDISSLDAQLLKPFGLLCHKIGIVNMEFFATLKMGFH